MPPDSTPNRETAPPPTVRVGLAQMRCVVGDGPANAAAVSRFAADAAAAGCAVLFLPELATTGYAPDAVRTDKTGADPLHRAAAEHGLTVVGGFTERAGDRRHNGLAVCDPAGEPPAVYRKMHLFDGAGAWEPDLFTPGERPAVCDLGGVRWGLSVCYDLRFPELYRGLADRGATALVNCSAWPAARWEHWDLLTRARAVENQTFFVACNRCGTDAGLTLAGRSRVVAPTGELLAEAGPNGEELLVADLEFAAVDAFRTALPALAARRPPAAFSPD